MSPDWKNWRSINCKFIISIVHIDLCISTMSFPEEWHQYALSQTCTFLWYTVVWLTNMGLRRRCHKTNQSLIREFPVIDDVFHLTFVSGWDVEPLYYLVANAIYGFISHPRYSRSSNPMCWTNNLHARTMNLKRFTKTKNSDTEVPTAFVAVLNIT